MRVRVQGSLQSRVFAAIKAAGEIGAKDLRDALGITESKDVDRVAYAIKDLRKAGHIVRTGRARYRFGRERKDIEYVDGQRRMMRVIRIRTKKAEPFSARTLAELADISRDWAVRCVRFLVREGFMERVGVEHVGPSRVRAPVYLAVEGKLNDEWPAYRREKVRRLEDERVSPDKPKPGEPCDHPGCCNHITHSCEGCGRIACR